MTTPPKHVWDIPEKVLQFGSGRFLRAFVEDYLDHANRQDCFQGRVVVVQSTGEERANLINSQNGLFTLCARGLDKGKSVESYTILSSVSRALAAQKKWGEILDCARNPQLDLVVSNTTEIGIALDADDSLEFSPPRSFPGKLTAILWERYRAFQGSARAGLVILPCELIEANGDTLKNIVLELSSRWGLENNFRDWIKSANQFCNTLVDRIVTGTPPPEETEQMWARLNFQDNLVTVAELYSLWAIEGDESLEKRLQFPEVNPQIVIADDISPYRERKLRILNGTHTLSAPASFLLGNDTMLESMHHSFASQFIERLMQEEIASSLDLNTESVTTYVDEVLNRFRNPYLKHQLLDITFQSTLKMRVRVVPIIENYYRKYEKAPPLLCLGFAFYLLFMRGTMERDEQIFGQREGNRYLIKDDRAKEFYAHWSKVKLEDDAALVNLVRQICSSEQLWGVNLVQFAGFTKRVEESLLLILRNEGELRKQRLSVTEILDLKT